MARKKTHAYHVVRIVEYVIRVESPVQLTNAEVEGRAYLGKRVSEKLVRQSVRVAYP